MSSLAQSIEAALDDRFGERLDVDPALRGLDELERIATRHVTRHYLADDVAQGLLRLLCACAMSAPSKSDLQQADIVVVRDKARRDWIADLLPDMPWLRQAPVFLVFLANGRRLPMMSQWRGKPFPNDHFDLLFNATVDAAIVLATFLRAAEAVGLGCCPISSIRDHAAAIGEFLELPDKVIPVAGMGVGWPAEDGAITPRLPLRVTLHAEHFAENNLAGEIDAYDHRRAALRPYRNQRDAAEFGRAEFYGWSEDKARQYATPLRSDFGAFVRTKGFHLD
jgi:nitroreductase/FMN reductase [NAD(P)H]